jgi:starch synthase
MAAEAVPFAKTGQVAEVITSLAQALRMLGHDVRIAMPRYGHVDPERFQLSQFIEPFAVPMDHHWEQATIYQALLPGDLPVAMIDSPRYFGRNANNANIDEAERFVFYSRATLEMLKRPELNWQPDIIHCHDWQTAIVPNWLVTVYKDDPFFANTATIFTIHRLAHQGIFGYRILEVAGIEEYGYVRHQEISELSELVDFMARGIYYADAITTVSECYAQEIQTPEFGERLDPLLRDRCGRLFGVLNGIDTLALNPATDPYIAAPFDATALSQRAVDKAALQRTAGLQETPNVPLIGMVSRLTSEKGLDLLKPVFETIMSNLDVQFVIEGVGEQEYHQLLSGYARRFAGRVGVKLTFNEGLERQIYAGSDIFLMPSRVEACGLGQMIAMRYGAVPVVRSVGGLADTVQNYSPTSGEGNGFSFQAYDPMALYTAIVRAVESYHHRDLWAALQQRCMTADFSWRSSATKYLAIYQRALAAHHTERHLPSPAAGTDLGGECSTRLDPAAG